jgi:hypothetical protein
MAATGRVRTPAGFSARRVEEEAGERKPKRKPGKEEARRKPGTVENQREEAGDSRESEISYKPSS